MKKLLLAATILGLLTGGLAAWASLPVTDSLPVIEAPKVTETVPAIEPPSRPINSGGVISFTTSSLTDGMTLTGSATTTITLGTISSSNVVYASSGSSGTILVASPAYTTEPELQTASWVSSPDEVCHVRFTAD